VEKEADGVPVTVAGLCDVLVVYVAVCVVECVLCVGLSVGGLRLNEDELEPVLIHVPVGVLLRDTVPVGVHVLVGMLLGVLVGGLRVCEGVGVLALETVSVSVQVTVLVSEPVTVRVGVGVHDRPVGVHVWVPFGVWVGENVGGDGERVFV